MFQVADCNPLSSFLTSQAEIAPLQRNRQPAN
jgi:hypothetical protein